MPVTSDQITQIIQAVVDLYRAAEAAILREVTRRLGQGMDAPSWAVSRLADVAALRRAVEQTLAHAEQAPAIRDTLTKAYLAGAAAATAEVPGAARAAVAEALPDRLIGNLAAALIGDVGQRHSNVLRHVLDVYRRTIAEATAVSAAGNLTRREASQLAYARFVDQGVTAFVDSAGRTWRMSSYVEMAVRTVTQRAAVQGQTDRLGRLGISTVIVSNEAQECRLCRPFEGKVLRTDSGPVGEVQLPSGTGSGLVTVDIAATLEAARARGFQHPNCRHSVRAYIPGATRQPAGPTEDPAGDLARQRQREIERNIRRWKERQTAALDPTASAHARAKVTAWQAEMRNHLAANPALKRLSYREQVGAGNLPR